ncbi:MAG: endopeptidase La [Lachnospirales bacterium]
MKKLPVIYLNDIVAFPNIVLSFDMSDGTSQDKIEKYRSMEEFFLVSAKNSSIKVENENNLNSIGVTAKLIRTLKLRDGIVRMFVRCNSKYLANKYEFKNGEIHAELTKVLEEKNNNTRDLENLVRICQNEFFKYASLSNIDFPELFKEIKETNDYIKISYLIGFLINSSNKFKYEILEENNVYKRFELILELLIQDIELLQYRNNLLGKVRSNLDENQKKYFLREEINVIQKELGEDNASEIEQYKTKISEKDLPHEIKEKLENEMNRLTRIPQSSPEGFVVRDYIEKVLSLPWGDGDTKNIQVSLKKAKEILDQDHYGLNKVKERIIEHLAVQDWTRENKSQVLCLVGPPGVGKTSIGKSIGKVTKRDFSRISLGGVRDESDIRGHRKTYIGAMPGRIIDAMINAKSTNPVILLDEIDKMSSDFRGDPCSALLEVLDKEQNYNFVDHYIGLPYDLSKVMFICTANNINNIPEPLKDRLEIIQLSTYTLKEKVKIAQNFIVPKKYIEYKISKSKIKFKDSVFNEIVKYYTRESGVRNLEKSIDKIFRKIITKIVLDDRKSFTITENNLKDFLGRRVFHEQGILAKGDIGIVRGLAFTSVGGTTLSIETNCLKGNGKISITGNIGKVMDESAKAALSYVREKSTELSINADFYKEYDIHIHIPEGATPKDGPSAGVTIATSIVSALLNKKVKSNIAMTGEITIRGRVLPVGGLKEKILAAKNIGIEKVFIPFDNKGNIEELEDYVKEDIKIIFVKHIEEILTEVFER